MIMLEVKGSFNLQSLHLSAPACRCIYQSCSVSIGPPALFLRKGQECMEVVRRNTPSLTGNHTSALSRAAYHFKEMIPPLSVINAMFAR